MTILNILIGYLATFVMEWAKNNPSIKWLTPETVGLIQMLLVVVSVAASVFTAWLAGPDAFAKFDLAAALQMLVNAVATYLTAYHTYKEKIKKAESKA